MLKNNKGITLIALVITIIVLLILAGVSIAMLTGQNGVLTKASNAKVANYIGEVKDQISLIAAETMTQYYEDTYVAETNNTTGNVVYDSNALDDKIKTNIEGEKNATKSLADFVANGVTIDTTTSGKVTVSYQGYKTTGTIKNGKVTWTAIDK